MTKAKDNTNMQSKTRDPHRYDELAAALVATPQVQTALRSITSYDDLVGGQGLIARMLKPLMQELLDAEMTEHLGYPKHDASGIHSGNNRNGSYERTLRGSDGPFALDVPRDRNGSFTSEVIPPYKQMLCAN